jgi:hypothetical protein
MSEVIRQNAIEVLFRLKSDGSREIVVTSPNVALLQGIALAYTEDAFAEFSDEQRAFLRWCMSQCWHTEAYQDCRNAAESISVCEAEEIIEACNEAWGCSHASGSVQVDDAECVMGRAAELVGIVDRSWNTVKADHEAGTTAKDTLAHLEMMLDKGLLLHREMKDQIDKGTLLDAEG